MSRQPSLITASIDFDGEGLQKGHLRIPYSHDRSAYGYIPIPLAVARRGYGPTVLLIGGNHGDEYEGPVALMRLMRELSLERLNGRIIMIPALNFPAYLAGTRTSPIDRLNLNRRFPGDRNASPTDMLAHYVETELLPMADYCLDFHAGGLSLNYLPTLFTDRPKTAEQRATMEKLVAAFHPPRVLYMDLLGEDRVIGSAAERSGVVFLTGEFGGGGTVNLEGLDTLLHGLAGVLDGLDVLRNDEIAAWRAHRPPVRKLTVKGAAHYIFATRSGIFEPCFRLGDEVRAGQIAGYIHDPLAPWQTPEEIRFAGSGLALCIRTYSLVSAGDCLGHLASDET